jgi:hypothetical protein
VTKIFTTNLLAQLASRQPSVLAERLSRLAHMGALPAHVGLMTLEELGDFASGVPYDEPPQCTTPDERKRGCICATVDPRTGQCIKQGRPTIGQYDAQDIRFTGPGRLFTCGTAVSHLIAERYEEAADWAERTLRQAPGHTITLLSKAVACAYLDRIEEARAAISEVRELRPWLTIAWFKASATRYLPEFRARYVDGLRKAGMPEE